MCSISNRPNTSPLITLSLSHQHIDVNIDIDIDVKHKMVETGFQWCHQDISVCLMTGCMFVIRYTSKIYIEILKRIWWTPGENSFACRKILPSCLFCQSCYSCCCCCPRVDTLTGEWADYFETRRPAGVRIPIIPLSPRPPHLPLPGILWVALQAPMGVGGSTWGQGLCWPAAIKS